MKKYSQKLDQCPNLSTTPITAIGYKQCLTLSVVQLKSEHYRNPHSLKQPIIVATVKNGFLMHW